MITQGVMGQIFLFFASYGYGQGWNSGGIGRLISGSYFSLMECRWERNADSTIKSITLHKSAYQWGLMKICISWTEFRNLTGIIRVVFHFLNYLKVSFVIRHCVNAGCVLCIVTYPEIYSLLLHCVGAIFFFPNTKIPSCQFHSEPGSESGETDAFLIWCTLFHLYSVSKKGQITDMHWKCSYAAVKYCVFRTSIERMLYAVNCKRHIVSAYIVICSIFPKIKHKWESLYLHSKIEKDSLIHAIQSWLSSVLLSFTFPLLAAFRAKTVSCHFLSRWVRTQHPFRWTGSCVICFFLYCSN